MADNVGITPGSGATAAADDIGGVLYQRVKIVTGTDGVADGDVSSANPMPVQMPGVTADDPLPVRLDQGPEAIISTNGSLQVDATQSNEMSAESLNARNAALRGDEPVQMVGLHPSYPLPIDTATPLPVAAQAPTGEWVSIPVVVPNVPEATVVTFPTSTPSKTSPIWKGTDRLVPVAVDPNFVYSHKRFAPYTVFNTGVHARYVFDTIGYSVAQILYIKGGLNIVGVEFTNDFTLGNWVQYSWYVQSGGVSSGSGQWQGGINPSGVYQIIVPCFARYMRLQSNVSNPQTDTITVTLMNGVQIPFTSTAANITAIGGTAVTAASAQLGVNAFGPTASGAAHSTNNPVQMSGSDGTNVRRILTDTSGNTRVVGPLAAGTSLIPPTNAAFAPALMGITDLEGRVRRITGDVRGRQAVTLPDATAADDGIIDALNNVVRELKLLNAKITDLPYWLGINSVMPDDGQSFRDDPTLFNK
jgi:hypothetical protein